MSWLQGLEFALRSLRSRVGTAAFAIATLAHPNYADLVASESFAATAYYSGGGLRIGVAGIALGALVTFAGARFAQGLLYGVPASDLSTLAATVLPLTATLLLACLLPARSHRAMP